VQGTSSPVGVGSGDPSLLHPHPGHRLAQPHRGAPYHPPPAATVRHLKGPKHEIFVGGFFASKEPI
jgi:hypothetical protein